jgi:hypothetical protein
VKRIWLLLCCGVMMASATAGAWASIDPPVIVKVAAGVNAGEPGTVGPIYCHPSGTCSSYSYVLRRIADACGQPLAAGPAVVLAITGSTIDNTCSFHGTNVNTKSTTYNPAWDVEGDLNGHGTLPGIYDITWDFQNGGTFTVVRTWGIDKSINQCTQVGWVKAVVLDETGTSHPAHNAHVRITDSYGHVNSADTDQTDGTANIGPFGSGTAHWTASLADGTHGETGTIGILDNYRTVTLTIKLGGTNHGQYVQTGAEDGGGNILNGTWWENLFTRLFVPSSSTLSAWDTLRASIAGWGPFGFVKDFWYAWNHATLTGGETAPVIPFILQAGEEGPMLFNGSLDLRVYQAEAYGGGGHGSIAGTWLHYLRVFAGWLVYGGYALALFRWFRPKMQV